MDKRDEQYLSHNLRDSFIRDLLGQPLSNHRNTENAIKPGQTYSDTDTQGQTYLSFLYAGREHPRQELFAFARENGAAA